MFCSNCYTDLSHVVGDQCEKCGRKFDRTKPRTFLARPFPRKRDVAATIFLTTIVAVVVAWGWRPIRWRGPVATDSPRFRYLFDPICVTAIALFALNRWGLKPSGFASAFTHGYLNDLLCLPIFVPLSLLMQKALRIRRHDRPPLAWEIAQHWLVFSILFEVLIPRLPAFRSTADPWDVVAYLVGGAVGWLGWHRRRIN